MTTPTRRHRPIVAAVGAGALVLAALVAGPAQATHGDVSLAGSNFEIDTNANLKVDHPDPPSLDWANVTEIRKADLPSGSGDDSFGQGAKEDTEVPTVVDGSIPPNKSDLKNFGLYLEEAATGDFLHLFWHRVQDPSGTTNMDFEFNQSETTSSNDVTPERTEGDLLIQYDLSQGGTNPQLFLAYWLTDISFDGDAVTTADCVASNSFPCWGLRDNLSASGDATGSINTTAIPSNEADGLGAISARTFGEATIDFDAIAGSGCVSFGSAYLKSRSSDSFTAALKDFIAPTETGLNNCGVLKIVKTKKHAEATPTTQPHAGVVFTVTGTGFPVGGTQYTTDSNGVICITGLEPGNYGVAETVPTGYAVTSTNPQTGVVVADSTCATATPVTFTNMPLTNFTVSVDSQIPGGTASTIDCDAAADPPYEATTGTGGDGSLTKSNLLPGTYVCTIIIDP